MKSKVKYWEHVIRAGKQIEPITNEDVANYELASYYVSQIEEKTAA
ncbi:MAG: hypothetical protein JEZ01_20960 [Labilibaculum sp.]|nr:hypothetical protein [Labilibaculum sp.]MBI9060250.1 hypothetical protein [Labilibaculum sp.]